jgi:hypothetical protein
LAQREGVEPLTLLNKRKFDFLLYFESFTFNLDTINEMICETIYRTIGIYKVPGDQALIAMHHKSERHNNDLQQIHMSGFKPPQKAAATNI